MTNPENKTDSPPQQQPPKADPIALPKPAAAPPEAGSAGNIEKVRDILFGSQMRDFEKKLSALGEKLKKDVAELREENRKHLESLENHIKKEFETVADQIKNERKARQEDVKELSENQKSASKAADRKLDDLEERTTRASRELREQIFEQSRSLTGDIRKRHDDLVLMLEETASELRAEKVNRSALSNLFSEIAMRLDEDWSANLDLKELGNE